MLERDIQKRSVARAKTLGVLSLKLSSETRNHIPDYLHLYEGRVYFVEYKAPGKHPRKAQVREHQRLRAAGFVVDVIDDVDYGARRMQQFVNATLSDLTLS